MRIGVKTFSKIKTNIIIIFSYFFSVCAYADIGDVYFCDTEKASVYDIEGKVGNLRPEKFKFTITDKSIEFRGSEIIGDYAFLTEKDGFGSSDLLFVGSQREVFSWVQNTWTIMASANFDGEIFKLTQNSWNGEITLMFARCDKF